MSAAAHLSERVTETRAGGVLRALVVSALLALATTFLALLAHRSAIFDDLRLWGYDVLVVPPLYVASDALLEKIAAFAKAGGHVLLTFKSGFTNEWDTVRWTRAPGPLREAAGVSYQEFSSLKEPLPLKGDPFGVGPENRASAWVDMLLVETAKPLASYDHPFF